MWPQTIVHERHKASSAHAYILLSGTCFDFIKGNLQQTVQDTHGATVIMQGEGNNSKDKKRSMIG